MALLESATRTHRDFAYHVTLGAGIFALVSGVGSVVGASLGSAGVVVALAATLLGVYLGSLEVAVAVELVVEAAGEAR
jgi:hypothetical protein